MHQFSRIRARARRNRDDRWIVAILVFAALAAPLPTFANGGGHEEPAPAAAPPAPPPPPPPPAKLRILQPPPTLSGPIAAPLPVPRIRWLADPTTGLALGGFDPVAYFLGGRPALGTAEHELDWGGTTWRFANAGNRAAFRDAPDIYAPAFGGRCAFAVSRGLPTEASPQQFLVYENRLLLFADPASRAAFLLEPTRLLAEADRRWPAVLADLP